MEMGGYGERGGGGGDRQEGKAWAPQGVTAESGRDRVEEEELLEDLQEALLRKGSAEKETRQEASGSKLLLLTVEHGGGGVRMWV